MPVRILAVDDIEDNLKVLKGLLNRHLPEAEVELASGGLPALEAVERQLPDVVLLDAKMPDLDGFEVCRRLKEGEKTSTIPVLMISGVYTDAQHRVSGLESGADGYICKPYQGQEMIAQVKALLRIKHGEDQLRRHEVELEQELEARSGALKESEARFRMLFENSPEAILVVDSGQAVLDVNPAACRLHMRTRAELVGCKLDRLVPASRREQTREEFRQLAEGEVERIEEFSLSPDGQKALPVELMARCIDFGGQPAVLLTARDITERKKIEDALKEVAQGVSAATGFSFFFSLVKHLARALHVDYVLLCETLDDENTRMSTLAVFADGEIADNFDYDTEGTPCAASANKKEILSVSENILHQFPDACLLKRWGVESYVGAPLIESGGRSVGVLAVMNRKPLQDTHLVESLLTIFAARAAAELERKKAAEELWESEERYRSMTDDVLDTSSIGTAILDADSEVIWLNQSYEKFFGLDRDKVIGRNKASVVKDLHGVVENPEVLEEELLIPDDTAALSSRLEIHVLAGEGRVERWLEHWSQPIRSGLYIGGRIEHYADITVRKLAEDKLRLSEKRLREHNRVLVDLARRKTIYHGDLQAALQEITEVSASTLDVARASVWLFNDRRSQLVCEDLYIADEQKHDLGRPLTASDYPAYFKELDQVRTIAAHDACADPRTREFAEGYLRPQNIVGMLDAPVRLGGRTLGVVCYEQVGSPREWTIEEENFSASMADLVALAIESREHHRTEADRDRLAMAIEQTVEAVVITDVRGEIQYVNPAFEQITGYTAYEAVGQTPNLLRSGRHDDAFYANMWETISKGGVWSGHMTNNKKDGSTYEAEVVISPMRDPEGRVVNYVSVSRDVTREVELEGQFRQAQKMESVGRLAGGIAHDFNNLLTSILGFSRLIQDQLETEDPIQSDIKEIVHAGERAAKLTRQLLAFGRKQIMQLRPLDVNEIVMEMDQLLRRTLGEDVELVTVLGDKLGSVEADAGLLEQVIMNLAVNARDAMPKGGKLTIETSTVTLDEEFCQNRVGVELGAYTLLAVSDIGMGMPDEVKDQVFEPFFTTKEKGKGTGLGLATVYGIVKQCRGYIEFDSEQNVGTTFNVYLPTIDSPSIGLPRRVNAEMPGGAETILIVEDEDTVRHLTVRMLTSLGYHVLEARHGGEALLICERYKEPIHLVITDVVMPHVGGHELMQRLKDVRADFRILYISGFTEDRILDHGGGSQGGPLLLKPYTSEALAQKVREILDAS